MSKINYSIDFSKCISLFNTLLSSSQAHLKFNFIKFEPNGMKQIDDNHETENSTGRTDFAQIQNDYIINDPPHISADNEFLPIHNDEGALIGQLKIEYDSIFHQKIGFMLTDEVIRILESSYDGIWITDGKGKVLYTNPANERLTGTKRHEVIGKMTHELIEDKLFSASATLAVMNAHKRVTIMGYNYKTNKQVLITGNPIFDKKGNLIYIVNNVRDITDFDNLRKALDDKDKIIDQQKTVIESLKTKKNRHDAHCIFRSAKMSEIIDLTERVGQFDLNVLILGESGAGKEVIADSIVNASDRRDQPFVKVNCGAIPETLLESELFGYEKGAFTGANQKGKIGMFELANDGTILLDEVADIPLNLQVKLLRAIQGKEIMRLGGSKSIKLNVRILAATNKNIEEMVQAGTFREDLYYRLNVVSINVPPLRERKEDIPLLIHHFMNHFNEKHHVQKNIETETVELLCNYEWPGNVRELENLIENLVVLTKEESIFSRHLPRRITSTGIREKPFIEINGIVPLKDAVIMLEDRLIEMAINEYGTTRKAASALGVDQSTIVRKQNR